MFELIITILMSINIVSFTKLNTISAYTRESVRPTTDKDSRCFLSALGSADP